MKNDSDYTKRFSTLFRKVKTKHKPEPPEAIDPVSQLVMSFLQWNATDKQATNAFNRIMEAVVDLNELRVSYCHQVVEMLGDRYPMAEERCVRMRESLQDVFHREHGVNLSRLSDMPKKQVRTYLDTLGGIPPFVAAQVTLLSFGGYAIPVDDNLKNLLASEDAIDTSATVDQVETFLQKQIKAADALNAHLSLKSWVDSSGRRGKITPAATKTTVKKSSTSSKPTQRKQNTTKKATKTVTRKVAKKVTKKTTKKKTARK